MFSSLGGYRRAWIAGDLVAGLTVWAVLVPEALAYATIAGSSATRCAGPTAARMRAFPTVQAPVEAVSSPGGLGAEPAEGRSTPHPSG